MTTTAGLTPAHTAEGTRARLLSCALSLFARNSFAGTSLQMIADKLGVTKAAVYHHFKTREDILASVIEPAGRELRAAVEAAQDRRTPSAQAETMLSGFVDLAVRHRALVALILTDAGVTHNFGSREDVAVLVDSLLRLLTAHQSGPEAEVNASLAVAGIACAAASPMLHHLSDEALAEHLTDAGRRILGLRRRGH